MKWFFLSECSYVFQLMTFPPALMKDHTEPMFSRNVNAKKINHGGKLPSSCLLGHISNTPIFLLLLSWF